MFLPRHAQAMLPMPGTFLVDFCRAELDGLRRWQWFFWVTTFGLKKGSAAPGHPFYSAMPYLICSQQLALAMACSRAAGPTTLRVLGGRNSAHKLRCVQRSILERFWTMFDQVGYQYPTVTCSLVNNCMVTTIYDAFTT